MEKLKLGYDKFFKAFDAMSRSLKLLSDQKDFLHETNKDLITASTIKHLELCYEMAWKFLKQYLEMKYDTKVDSPKKVFRECFAHKIIDQNTTRELLAIAEARNATTHDYDEETAQEILLRIGEYKVTFARIIDIKI